MKVRAGNLLGDEKVRQLPQYLLRVCLSRYFADWCGGNRNDRQKRAFELFVGPRGRKSHIHHFQGTPEERGEILRLRDAITELRQKRNQQRSSEKWRTMYDRKRELRDRFRQLVLDMIPAKWCERIRVQVFDEGEANQNVDSPHRKQIAMLRYHENVSWPYAKSYRYPKVFDELWIHVKYMQLPVISADGKEITLGGFTWRKNRGHSLSIRYTPQGKEVDRESFLHCNNQEMRRAVIASSSTDCLDLIEGQVVQQDDFGQLLVTKDYGKFVKVTCPSTGRIYLLGVPANVPTAHAAVAATFGLKTEAYSPAHAS